MKAHLISVAAGLFLLGCASDKSPAPNADVNHPANPHAAEGATTPVSDTLASPHGAVTTPATTQSADGYTCPMHPQVMSATPGDCPICHMTLVAKKGGAAHDHSKGAGQ